MIGVNKDLKKYITSRSKKCTKTGCWNWIISKDPAGYGQAHINNVRTKAHRVSYLAYIGQIPKNLCVCHSCDNRSCVNPEHFFIGTMGDNMRDRNKKGRARSAPGEKHPASKLTDKIVKEIKKLYFEEKVYQREIARKFGVSQVTISDVITGKKWKS